MNNEFNSVHKYAVAMADDHYHLRLVTRRRKFSEKAMTDNYEYQIATSDEINEEICTVDTLGELLLLIDNIKTSQLYGSAGEIVARGQTLIPVMLNVTATDCTDEIDAANLSLKREKALAKLNQEDKMVLGIK